MPIPIPIDFIVIGTASGSAGGKFVLWQAVTVLFVAMVGGGCVQFALARGPGRKLLYRYGHYMWLTRQRLDTVCRRVQNVGRVGIAISAVTPGLRTATIPACGLTAVRFWTFFWGLTGGTLSFLAIQFFVGYAGTELVLRFWNGPAHAALLVAAAVVGTGIAWLTFDHVTRHPGFIDSRARLDHAPTLCPYCRLTRYALSFSAPAGIEISEAELGMSGSRI